MSTVAFTLPVSCQVCLGKVKQPVVCPNLHVFCAVCMDMWLQRSQQCPTCRVPITSNNPCRQVLGGLNPQTEQSDASSFSNKELRRCRMELVYKEYENELERLEKELNETKKENKDLWKKIQSLDWREPEKSTPSKQDISMIASINNKLKDATKLYENIKGDMKAVKKENKGLKDEAENLKRENQTLRLELSQRSPRKFGRYTVATLENKVESCETEIKQLQKALERGDLYIAELEADLKAYKEVGCEQCQTKSRKDKHIDFDDSRLDDSELPSRISNVPEITLDSEAPITRNGARYDESFGLELPSPMTPGTITSSININESEKDSFLFAQPSPYKDKSVDSAKKKLRFSVPNVSSDEYIAKSSPTSYLPPSTSTSTSQQLFPATSGSSGLMVQQSSSAGSCLLKPGSSQANLNISITPEMEDCLRLMDQAEKRCKDNSPPQQASSSKFIRHSSFGQSNVSSFARGLITTSESSNLPSASSVAPLQYSVGTSLPSGNPVLGSQGLSTVGSCSTYGSAPSLSAPLTSVSINVDPTVSNLRSLSQQPFQITTDVNLRNPHGTSFRP